MAMIDEESPTLNPQEGKSKNRGFRILLIGISCLVVIGIIVSAAVLIPRRVNFPNESTEDDKVESSPSDISSATGSNRSPPNITDIGGVVKTDTHVEQETDNLGHLLQPRIVGGSDVADGAYPYFVRLDKFGYPSCGGSLVAPDVVLTAAHCGADITDLGVLVNGYHDDTTNINLDQRYRAVIQAVEHPFYNPNTYYNDLLLLKLNQPVTDIQFVELNKYSDAPVNGDRVTVMGLGALAFGGGYPDVLQSVEVGVFDHTTCNDAYEGVGLWPILDSIMVCAGYRIGQPKDSCQGDSGGPLIDERGVQVGVVSFGLGCAMQEFPGVYARTAVKEGQDWLGQALCNLTDSNALDNWCTSFISTSTERVDASPTIAPISPTSAPVIPTALPTALPTTDPTESPTLSPTPAPITPAPVTEKPTLLPTVNPTVSPTLPPTSSPVTEEPTSSPTEGPTEFPTVSPTLAPVTNEPSLSPTVKPTEPPSTSPTPAPVTETPTAFPTLLPTEKPTEFPTSSPTLAPATDEPTSLPTVMPTESPTTSPTLAPVTEAPTTIPTALPTVKPIGSPSLSPTSIPTAKPTDEPTLSPTIRPTDSPTQNPTSSPTEGPTALPTIKPTGSPSLSPTSDPTAKPTDEPTLSPTIRPTDSPTQNPTSSPTERPTDSQAELELQIQRSSGRMCCSWDSTNCGNPDLNDYCNQNEQQCMQCGDNKYSQWIEVHASSVASPTPRPTLSPTRKRTQAGGGAGRMCCSWDSKHCHNTDPNEYCNQNEAQCMQCGDNQYSQWIEAYYE